VATTASTPSTIPITSDSLSLLSLFGEELGEGPPTVTVADVPGLMLSLIDVETVTVSVLILVLASVVFGGDAVEVGDAVRSVAGEHGNQPLASENGEGEEKNDSGGEDDPIWILVYWRPCRFRCPHGRVDSHGGCT